MSFAAATLRWLRGRPKPIGPGRLVLVVGPSGAGKDTLIAHARAACAGGRTVVFPKRIVTRPPSPFEDNAFMTVSDFEQAVSRGDFALWWSAHGHNYAIPLAIDHEVEAGRTVVCNVSRTVIAAARQRYANVVTVLVTAPFELLQSRLAARARGSDGRLADRLDRAEIKGDDLEPDLVIHNVGAPEIGARKLLDAFVV